MGVTYNNGAPVFKIEKPNYTMPDYTIDNFIAREEWNKEIANNKQGYMGVEIMNMKDFYDAGGYSFVDDYRAELGSLDAAYDRALPGYGVKGEQMAQAGMTGSGYGDYLSGQAYALRASGQALARQNIMANSNSFRAAYNSYVAQQKDKREQNLQTVIDKAYQTNMDPEMFVEMATKLGIPQADAERGKDMLIAYYQGFGSTKNAYGLTDAEQTQASSLVQQIIQGAGTYADTSAIKNMFVGISGSKNAEAIYNAALQQAKEGVLAELQGKLANGYTVTADELATLQRYYGFTEEEIGGITTGMKELEESGGGKLSPEQQTQASSYADLFNTALSDAIENNTAFSLNTILGVNHLDESDPLVKAAIDDFQSIQAGAYEEQIAQGAFVSKKALDTAKSSRLISDEQYKDLLGKAQKATSESLINALTSGDTDMQIDALSTLGYDTTSANEDNIEAMLFTAVTEQYKAGNITEEQKKVYETERIRNTIDRIADQQDLIKTIVTLQSQNGGSMAKAAELFGITNIYYSEGSWYEEGIDINLRTESGTTIKVYAYTDTGLLTESQKRISNEIENGIGKDQKYVVQYNGELYMKSGGRWKQLIVYAENLKERSIIEDWLKQFYDEKKQQEMSDRTKKELQNTLNVTQRRDPMRVATK